jgi:hypothetical protein
MSRFIVLYTGDQPAADRMAAGTPEEQAAGMLEWMAWAQRAGDAIVDLGTPLTAASAGANPGLGGYSILEAASADAVQALLAGHPHTSTGGTIDVYECLPLPGM